MRTQLLILILLTGFPTAGAVAQAIDGAALFERNCIACHTLGGGDRVGPDLARVSVRRDGAWLRRMISEPDALIAEGDPIMTRLIERYNGIVMPNLGLDDASTDALLAHLRAHDAGGAITVTPAAVYDTPRLMQPQARIWHMFLLISAVIALVFAVIAFSTRRPREVDTARAYGIRRVLFLAALAAVIGVLATTLPDAPYTGQHDASGQAVDRIVYVTARQFEFIWSDEPIASRDDIGRVPRLGEVLLKAGSTVEFRVSSLDVNHGFGLYGPERQLVAQTQAMPGYINRLKVRVDEPGDYLVLCLEYCAAGHHRMRSSLSVR